MIVNTIIRTIWAQVVVALSDSFAQHRLSNLLPAMHASLLAILAFVAVQAKVTCFGTKPTYDAQYVTLKSEATC